MKKKRFFDLIIVLLAGIMLFSGYKLFTISQAAKESKEQYHQIEQLIDTPAVDDEPDEYITSQQKYQSVYTANNDFVGWIYVPGTELNYPVMHTPSNPEYYLRRDFEGKYNIHGVPFIDYRCVVDKSDNIIIYGHNMMNGTMFSIVEDYADKSYWEVHRYIGFDTMNGYGTYEVAICAGIDLTTVDFNYTDTIDFTDKDAFDGYIKQIKEYACYETDVELCYGDKLILLSTCETNNNNGRYIIIAKKVSDDSIDKVKNN